jgi:phosphatidyl-myo-inositol dimannoside synthase
VTGAAPPRAVGSPPAEPRVLFLGVDLPPLHGGIARLYSAFLRHFPPGAVELSTVALPEGAPEPDSIGATPVHRMRFGYHQARYLTSVIRWTRWLRGRLSRDDVDIIFSGDLRPTSYVAAWAHSRRGVPYIIYVHGNDVWKEEWKLRRSLRSRLTARWILGGAAAVVANSRATAARARRVLAALGLDPDRVRVVNPGTDPERFRPDVPEAALWRERLGLAGKTVVLTVARMVEAKGVATALDAFGRVSANRPELVYLVAGSGPDLQRFERLAAELGIERRVRFLGSVADAELPGLYAAADIFLLPTREVKGEEGFGIVFCEAAACGTPSVAGASGGVADAVQDGETGLLVPPLDTDAVAAALERLVADSELRRRMGAAGRAAVERYYRWDRAAAELWQIIRQHARQ